MNINNVGFYTGGEYGVDVIYNEGEQDEKLLYSAMNLEEAVKYVDSLIKKENNKYIVKDWAGNVMNWGTFSDFDYAQEAITMHVLGEMSSDGYDTKWVEDGGDFDEGIFSSYCDEYFVDEIEEN